MKVLIGKHKGGEVEVGVGDTIETGTHKVIVVTDFNGYEIIGTRENGATMRTSALEWCRLIKKAGN